MNMQSWLVLVLVLVAWVLAVRWWRRRPNPCAGCKLKDCCSKQSCEKQGQTRPFS